jgi:hypothetical protein
MKRQTTTHVPTLPILIHCEKGEEEGEALMLTRPQGDALLLKLPNSRRVRRFKDTDFTSAQKCMGDSGTKRFKALRLLQVAVLSKQREDIKRAREMLCEIVASGYPLMKRFEQAVGIPRKKQGKKPVSSYSPDLMGQLKAELDRIHDMHHPADLDEETERLTTRYLTEEDVRLLAMETTDALVGVQLVLWLSGARLIPALYCQSLETAAYAFALFGRRWTVCPYSACGKWFIPKNPTQLCCCPEHTVAHRVARWRERHKVETNRR